MIQEVEIKIEVSDDDIRRMLSLLTGRDIRKSIEVDIYYTSRYRDLIGPEECVRIRYSDSIQELTWKPPTTAVMRDERQTWKEELNVPIGGRVDDWRKMMDKLDLVEYVVVEKDRTHLVYDNETNIMIDRVKNVGSFVEIETNSADYGHATKKNRSVMIELGLNEMSIVNVPYRDLTFSRRLIDTNKA